MKPPGSEIYHDLTVLSGPNNLNFIVLLIDNDLVILVYLEYYLVWLILDFDSSSKQDQELGK